MSIFDVHKIDPHTFMITGLAGENAYLLLGVQKALLIDTLTGVDDLRHCCKTLTDLPIQVVNTHGHVDHCGGNYCFPECNIHPKDAAMMSLSTTVERRMEFLSRCLGSDSAPGEECFSAPCPIGIHPVEDGDIFDLGGRWVEVIGVPGHSAGSIVLLDLATRMLFSGDACNANTLLCLPGSTTVEEYLESLDHLKSFMGGFDKMYGGHDRDAVSSLAVHEAIELCHDILNRRDDAVPGSHAGRHCLYAKKKAADFVRLDGGYANIAYTSNRINLCLRDMEDTYG